MDANERQCEKMLVDSLIGFLFKKHGPNPNAGGAGFCNLLPIRVY